MIDSCYDLREIGRRLVSDRNGAVAIIFALALIPLTVVSGLAVDLGRAYVVKNRLAYALDAAGLAVGSSSSSDALELQTLAQSFFDANYPADELGVPVIPTLTIDEESNLITLSATADVNTLLMQTVGIETITVAATTQITIETTGLEVVLALDNTGSMSGSKLAALKTASNSMLDILFGDETEPETLFVGIVPFAAMVNIGTVNESLLTSVNQALYNPVIWSACVDARSNPRDQTDDPPSVERWVPWLAPFNFFFNRFPPVSGSRGEFRGPNFECPVSLLPLTNVKSTIQAKITGMVANGFTHVNLGAVWAWRVISPGEPFAQGSAYDDDEFSKAVIIMTDGSNTAGDSLGSAYDGLVPSSQLNSRLLTVCESMRDLGILVYTIAFGNLSSSTRNLMSECAGDDSSRFFNSPSSSDLQSAFESIGSELSNLRISK